MLRRKIAGLSVMLLASQIASQIVGIYSPTALAQDTAGATSGNPDNWPWMQVNPDAVKTGKTAPKADTHTDIPFAEPGLKPTSIDANATLVKPESAKPESTVKHEEAKAAVAEPKKAERPAFDVYKEPPRTTLLKEEHASAAGSAQPRATNHMLFGRIEELASGTGAKFPIQLRAQKATLDPRETTLKGAATDTMYSGSLVRSFPTSMQGTWGGTLRLMQIQIDPLSYELDAAEAKQTAELAKPGIDGQVNFTFQNQGSGVTLEPSQIIFQSPMTESRMASMMKGLGNGSMTMPGMGNMAAMPGMQQMMQQMVGSMPYTWALYFGSTQGVGLSGNSVQTTLLRNNIRELSPTVLEEQIVSQETNTNPTTGRTRHSYSESVVRFTQYSSTQKYVQAACVDYNSDKRFLRKMVFAGYVTKGAVQNTNPMGSGSMGGLEKLFAPGGGMQMDPNGANPFKGLFGQ